MGIDTRTRDYTIHTQSDVIEFMLEQVDALVTRSNYHFVDIGEGSGFVTSRVSGFASVVGYEITRGEDFFATPASGDPTIYYCFNPFHAQETARLNAHLRNAQGYLVYYDAQWDQLLQRNLFTEVFSRYIVGGWFRIYRIK